MIVFAALNSWRSRVVVLASSACLLIQSGCHTPEQEPPQASTQAAQPVSGKVLEIQPVSWPTIARVQGSLMPYEVTLVSARVPGRIIEMHRDLGDDVEQGDSLFQLDPTEYELRVIQAESQLSQARAAVGLRAGAAVEQLDPMNAPPVREARAILEEAQQQVERLRGLFEQGTVVATDLETAELDAQVAEAQFNSALNGVREKIALIGVQSAQLELARQQLSDTSVTAPLLGRIQRRLVAPGTYIQSGQSVLEIARTDVLRYRATVPERYAQRVRTGQSLQLSVDGVDYSVQVTRISPTLDTVSRSLAFEAEVPNADNRLRGGLFAGAALVLDEQATAIAVPTTALVRFAGVDKVWQVADGQVSESVVQIGREQGDFIEILDGLSVGDVILVDGKQGRVAPFSGGGALGGAELAKTSTSKSEED